MKKVCKRNHIKKKVLEEKYGMEKQLKKHSNLENNKGLKKIFYYCIAMTICSIVMVGIVVGKIIMKDYSYLLLGEIGQIFGIIISAVMWSTYNEIKQNW